MVLRIVVWCSDASQRSVSKIVLLLCCNVFVSMLYNRGQELLYKVFYISIVLNKDFYRDQTVVPKFSSLSATFLRVEVGDLVFRFWIRSLRRGGDNVKATPPQEASWFRHV